MVETGFDKVLPNPGEAMNWYEKARQLGSPDSYINMAILLFEGRGI